MRESRLQRTLVSAAVLAMLLAGVLAGCGSDGWSPSRPSEVPGMPQDSVKQFARFGVVVESRQYLPGESAEAALAAFAERYPSSAGAGATPEAFPVEIVESGDPFFEPGTLVTIIHVPQFTSPAGSGDPASSPEPAKEMFAFFDSDGSFLRGATVNADS
jgi:hypothetical protein